MLSLRNDRGRSLWENLIIGAVMVVLIYVAVLYYHKASLKARVNVLHSDMRNLRLAINLYLYHNGQLPKDIRDLERERFIEYGKGGEIIKREYIKMVAKDEEGYPLDSFGNRYHYNPNTGMVHPATPGYETW